MPEDLRLIDIHVSESVNQHIPSDHSIDVLLDNDYQQQSPSADNISKQLLTRLNESNH